MEYPNMITLPPKYLKPIIINVNSTDMTTTTTENYSADYSATATQDYQFQTTTSTDYQATTDYNTTTDYQAPTTDYQMGTTDFTTTTSTTDYNASYEQPTFTATESTFDTGAMSAEQGVKIIRRGSGITLNEQNKIVSTAQSIVQNGLTPLSNKTAQGVKKALGGDWLVIVYPEGKPIDFNMTCVQGNDYLYFILGGNAYQVCRLR
jgi:hypothetical protein